MELAGPPKKLAGRYEVREILGQGGMGLVYRAYDTIVRREVAVKTILDIPDPASLQLFYKECDVLASMSHPNIVEIFDIGEFEDEGKKKPYFVMPLLPGTTLDHCVRTSSHRLTVERTVEIISQTCRGLQAAHERGLVHRDLKPSNIFVMEDDSVKIIDFGVAHMADTHTTRAQKGTLLYMSPEQIQLKPLSAASDIFSLSVVCYEALTGRHPFQRARADEVVEAILNQSPPPASEVNSAVSQSLSRVVHKGMAKQAWHRFSNARELGDTLGKALRNENIEFFDPERTRPRLQRATKALAVGDLQFAGEIVGELEAEGHMDAEIGSLRRQLDNAVRRKTLAQLLDAARARFEEEEDPLALQKLQEALQIEPDNATALALKSKIENRRSERQIENWYRLARQHIENHAYPHAREALQNVLQLRPRENGALQLLAEVDRQEQDYKKLRQEKEQIHRAAMDAWEKGDVSSALAKLGVVLELDRKAPDSVNRESGAHYQSFYNEVRSEHDAMNTAYAEARKLLADRNFVKALSTCQMYLAKYPTNAIFQALRYDIEEQQRQELSALIAQVDRQVEAEPDLDKRVSILREALERHPGEWHFERALRLVQDKRDLVNSIVARAHLHEEQAAFGDALNDWEILRTIYNQYPGLKFEVERLQKRRDQQLRIESKTRLIEQIDSCLHSSDFDRAFELLQEGAKEFPNDEELQELEKHAQQGVARKTEAQRLMAEGQELCGQQKSSEGIPLLRQAYELDENDTIARAVLANALVEEAQTLVEKDWRESEKLAKEAFELNPSHPMAKTLRTLILDQKRETFVGECVSQARKLQTSGDLNSALSRVEEGLSSYPREMRLIQIRDAVQRDLHVQRRQTRRRDLDELRRLDSEADSATDAAAKQTLGAKARALADKYLEDEEVLSSANGLLQKLNLPGVTGKGSTPAATSAATLSFAAAPTIETPLPQIPLQGPKKIQQDAPVPASQAAERGSEVPKANATKSGAPKSVAPRPASTRSVVKPVLATPAPQIRKPFSARPGAINRKLTLATGAVVVIVAALFFALRGHKQSAAVPQPTALQPAAAVSQPEPVLPAIKLSADVAAGKVSIDDQPPVDLQDAQWGFDKLAAGDHTIKFESPAGSFEVSVSSTAATLPAVKTPIAAKGILAVIVSSMGDRMHVYASDSAAKLSVDAQSTVDIPPDGVDLSSMTPGAHELTISHSGEEYKLSVDVTAAPSLNAFVESGQNVGSLVVVTGQDKTKVFLNGKPLEQQTQAGQLRIANLEPKEYVVRVTKPGFQDVADQKIRIRKGQQGRVVFGLLPVPHMASLVIQGGPAGAAVFVDQATAGTIASDGTLNLSTIAPGDHVIELRKDRFKPRQIKKHFVVGAPVTLTSADTGLEVAPGEVKITFSPADAQITLTKQGESPVKVSNGNPVSLPAGTYTLSARTTDGVVRTAALDVAAGQSRTLDLPLAPAGMSKWDDPAGWKEEKGVFVRKGGDYVLYGVSPTSGIFVFSAMLTKGHRLQWVVNYTDANNYDLFQVDDNNFYRTDVRNGQKVSDAKIPHKGDKKSFRTFQIRVSPSEIVSEIKQGEAWFAVDKFVQPGTNLAQGKFGFYLPGGDQISLSNFAHYLDLNLH
ncbi:MAG TPA: protein kinase [Candidatus Binatia bacterium]|nr:protein kinase [Candidatus Binatia bacterium]